jgi:hypothetical protein
MLKRICQAVLPIFKNLEKSDAESRRVRLGTSRRALMKVSHICYYVLLRFKLLIRHHLLKDDKLDENW